jgi:hypothetical protein
MNGVLRWINSTPNLVLLHVSRLATHIHVRRLTPRIYSCRASQSVQRISDQADDVSGATLNWGWTTFVSLRVCLIVCLFLLSSVGPLVPW